MIGKLVPIRRHQGITDEMSDEALVAACSASDPAALALLFDRHHHDIHRFLGRLSGIDADHVDDLLQETFIQLFSSARSFRQGSAVRTWIFGIAANLAKRHIRSDIRQKARAGVYLAKLSTNESGPAERNERDQLIGRVEAAIQTLPYDQRVAFILNDVEEIRGVDAAKALGVREGTFYRRLHEARKTLRLALERGGP